MSRYKMVEIECLNCGKKKLVRESRVKQGLGKFCSRQCSGAYQREDEKLGIRNGKKHFDKRKVQWCVHWRDENRKQHETTYAHWAWEMNFGSVPDGYRVTYVDGNYNNLDIRNLKLISLEELGAITGERQKGRTYSPETIEKMRQAKLGKKLSDEHRAKMSEHFRELWAKEDSPFRTDEYIERLRTKEPHNRGKKSSMETREKQSKAHRERYSNPKFRLEQSERLKKLHNDNPELASGFRDRAKKLHIEHPEISEKVSKKLKGRIFTDEHRENLSRGGRGKHSGSSNPHYIDGRSKIPYPNEFSRYLKQKIRRRYGNICQVCGKSAYARSGIVHHINGDKQNCSEDNLILVCLSCHNTIHGNSKTIIENILEFRNKLK